MKRKVGNLLAVLSGLLMSSAAFAAEGDAQTIGLVAIGSGLAIGLAALGAATGQGKTASAALEGLARNPTSYEKVFTPMLIALALIEFQAIMGFIIAYLWLSK